MSQVFRGRRGGDAKGRALTGLAFAVAVTLASAAGGEVFAQSATSAYQTAPYRSQQRGLMGADVGETPRPDGLFFEPRIESTVQYFDNLNLAESGQRRDNSTGLEVAPGIFASYKTPRFNGLLDASLIGRAWWDSDYNEVSGLLDALGRWTAIEDMFFVDGRASYQTAVVDPAQGSNYGGLGIYRNGATTDLFSASITPSFYRRFGDFEVRSSYSAGSVWYLNKSSTFDLYNQEDSFDQRFTASAGLYDNGRALNAKIFYEWNSSEYDVSLPYRLERLGADASWRISESLYLVGDGGVESDLFADISAGGLDSEFWHAGLRWVPSSRTSAEVRYGNRFNDDSYSATITHRARLLQLEASYSEEPTVQSRRRSLGTIGSIDLDNGGSIDLDNQPTPGLDFGAFESAPFIQKDGRISAKAAGARTSIEATVYRTKREYFQDIRRDEREDGVVISGSRRFAPNFSMDMQASYRDYNRAQFSPGAEVAPLVQEYDTQFVVRANQGFMERLTASAELGYFNRGGNSDTDGWWVALRLRYLPKFR